MVEVVCLYQKLIDT